MKEKETAEKIIYITNDVESAGSKLNLHSTLSIGASIVPREHVEFEEYWKKGLVFYAELQPESFAYEPEAMIVGCSQLLCLDQIRLKDPCYDSRSPKFNPIKTLVHMSRLCEHPAAAAKRFQEWIRILKHVCGAEKVIGVTDTIFFDGGRVDLWLSKYSSEKSPYGWTGLDINSTYRGYTGRAGAKIKDLKIPDQRTYPHRADQDAVMLAQMGREFLFKKMGW